MFRLFLATLTIVFGLCGAGLAEDRTWPDKMTIAGFEIVGIRGTDNADGSGTASGSLKIPGVSSAQPVSLTRSRSGEISAACSINFRAAGAELRGGGVLGSAGLKVTGSLYVSGKTVAEVALTGDSDGRFEGSGRLQLGSVAVPVRLSLSSSDLSVSGSAQIDTETDTALASYRFRGQLAVGSQGGRLTAAASGTVTRKGKFSDQLTTHSVSNVPVGVGDGFGSADVGGVSVRFRFF